MLVFTCIKHYKAYICTLYIIWYDQLTKLSPNPRIPGAPWSTKLTKTKSLGPLNKKGKYFAFLIYFCVKCLIFLIKSVFFLAEMFGFFLDSKCNHVMKKIHVFIIDYLSLIMRKPTMRFPNMSDTNRTAQS